MSDHLAEDQEVYADGQAVPWVGFDFAAVDREEPGTPLDIAFAEAGETLKHVIAFALEGKSFEEIGIRMVSVAFRLNMTPHSSVTAQADAFGWTKQRFGKHLKKAELSLPLHGIMSAEQRQRMALSKRRGPRKNAPLTTQSAEQLNRSVSRPDNIAAASTEEVSNA